MKFELIQQIVTNINNTIQQTAIGMARSLMAHTFGVKVKNFPKNQRISGTVTVANQKKVEKQLLRNGLIQNSVLSWLKAFKLPTSINISNFPSFPKFPVFPEGFKILNFPKQLPYPKNIRVTNQPTAWIKKSNTRLLAIEKAVKAIKLDPKITVVPPVAEKIIVPAPKITIPQSEKFDYKKLSSLMPQPTKEIDYKKLSESISKEIASSLVSVGGGGSRSNNFLGRDGKPRKAIVDEKGRIITHPDYFIADKSTSGVIYTGNENPEGAWFMMRVDGDEIRYASNNNNSNISYPVAWAAKEVLNYDYPSNVDF